MWDIYNHLPGPAAKHYHKNMQLIQVPGIQWMSVWFLDPVEFHSEEERNKKRIDSYQIETNTNLRKFYNLTSDIGANFT